MRQIELLLTLLNFPGIGKKTAMSIIEGHNFRVSSSYEILNLLDDARRHNKRIKPPGKEGLHKALASTEKTLRECEKGDISIISLFDEDYPKRYKAIPNRPLILYAKGDITTLNSELAVAIIGTREPTAYGKRAGRRLASVFTEQGFVVVSGLAKGCDTAAHQGCLDANGKTVAIFGTGIDYVYPKENRDLANEIVDGGGCWLSEYKPGTKPRPNFFVERDRLQSGLSQAVVVIETDVKGGTMHTVGFAQKQERFVACMGGHPQELADHPKIQGNAKLIAEGTATRLSNPEEINAFINTLKQPEHISTIEQPEQDPTTTLDSETQGELF